MWNEGDPRRELRGHEVAVGRSGSDVVVMDDRVVEAASRAQPGVTNINVTKSSRLHIGPKFVSVTQNVDNTEVVKGRILGLELVSPQNPKRLRCSIAVFVCWAFVVASGLTFFIFYFALAKHAHRLDLGRILGLELVSPQNPKRLRCSIAVFVCWAIVVASGLTFFILYFALATHAYRLDLDLKADWYLRRADWQAMPDYGIVNLNLPVSYVIISHSGLEHCMDRVACIRSVLALQSAHQRLGWVDIGPNFVVGGNGLVFEGRGANVLGVMVKSWNLNGISIMFVGDYMTAVPVKAQFDNVNVLLEELVAKGVLRPDYTIFGHCQVQVAVIPPGINLLRQLKNFEHWNSTGADTCIGWNTSDSSTESLL